MKTTFYVALIAAVVCFGFAPVSNSDYQLVPFDLINIQQQCHPLTDKSGTFIYTDSRSYKKVCSDSLVRFDFNQYRVLHVQYKSQKGCSNQVELIQEVRRYKHYYEVILTPYQAGTCNTMVKPYQVAVIPNDGLPVLFSGSVPE